MKLPESKEEKNGGGVLDPTHTHSPFISCPTPEAFQNPLNPAKLRQKISLLIQSNQSLSRVLHTTPIFSIM